MNRYDTTFIVNPQVGDEGINASVKEVTDLITSFKGEVLRENRIGSRRLAYPIQRQSHGYFVSLIYDGPAEVLKELEKRFKLGESYLRHLTIRHDGDPMRLSVTEVMMGYENRRRDVSGVEEKSSTSSTTATRPIASAPAASESADTASVTADSSSDASKAAESTPADSDSADSTAESTPESAPDSADSSKEETL